MVRNELYNQTDLGSHHSLATLLNNEDCLTTFFTFAYSSKCDLGSDNRIHLLET